MNERMVGREKKHYQIKSNHKQNKERKKLNDWSENRAGEEDQRHFGVF